MRTATVCLGLSILAALLGCCCPVPVAKQPQAPAAQPQPPAELPAPKKRTVGRDELHAWLEGIHARNLTVEKALEDGRTQTWGQVKGGLLLAEQKDLTAAFKAIAALGQQEEYPESTRKTMRRAESHLANIEFMLGLRAKR